jgi:predicted TIM-barrel fold metal-dependent hydrolase
MLFPPIGNAAIVPFTVAAGGARDEREAGLGIDAWLYFLDTVGIERTVLYPTLGLTVGRIRDLDYAVALTRAYNDWLSATYLCHPSGRFEAAALLPLQAPADAAVELRRAVDELGFRAGVLPANGLPVQLGSEQLFPVYEVAEALGVGLGAHGGDGHGGLGLDDLNSFAPLHALGHPFTLLRALAGMLSNRVFEQFPRLRVAYLEGGAAWTLLADERLSESFAALPAAGGDRSLVLGDRSAGDYLRELVHDGRVAFGCEGGEQHLATAIGHFGTTPFMFSSDYPHEVSAASCRHELEELAELPVSEASKAALRGGTARAFYRLP